MVPIFQATYIVLFFYFIMNDFIRSLNVLKYNQALNLFYIFYSRTSMKVILLLPWYVYNFDESILLMQYVLVENFNRLEKSTEIKNVCILIFS